MFDAKTNGFLKTIMTNANQGDLEYSFFNSVCFCGLAL